MTNAVLNQIIDSGIKPLEVELHPVREMSFDNIVGYRTVLKINSTELGVLYPEQYRLVTNRNMQCVRLAKWCLKSVGELLNTNVPFVSVYVPVKMLLRGDVESFVSSSADKYCFSKLVLEFSSDILLSDVNEVCNKLNELKEYGIRFMLCEFGDEFCPVLRIAKLPFDMVVLDKSLCSVEALNLQQTGSVINMANDCDMSVLVDAAKNSDLITTAADNGCTYYIEKRFVHPEEVIKRNA